MSDRTMQEGIKPSGKLSLRIVSWVFVSVIVIEAIIFIPSYMNRRDELLEQLRAVSTANVSIIMQMTPKEISEPALVDLFHFVKLNPMVIGGALYDMQGRQIGTFGEPPQLQFPDTGNPYEAVLFDPQSYRYDIVSEVTPAEHMLIIRHDASSVRDELWAFKLRIGGLVVIISIFVTLGAWVAIKPLVITPILSLRSDLLHAGEAVRRDQPTPHFHSTAFNRQDELGEVIGEFTRMYKKITEAINERKEAEHLLQESLNQVESYSQKLNTELEQGRRMQTNFLPEILPQPPGWEIAAVFRPARQVAGDFYDVFELPKHHTGLVIADVCDKGVGAALFMALFRSLIRIFSGQTALKGLFRPEDAAACQPQPSPTSASNDRFSALSALAAVELTNTYIAKNHGALGMFATLFFGVLDLKTGVMRYINGGHESAYIIGPQGIKNKLEPNGPAVGVLTDAQFEVGQTVLAPGDGLVTYTDGITEARSPQGTLFGRARLDALLNQPISSAGHLIELINSQLYRFVQGESQEDDVTILAISRRSKDDV